jgi:hypothetical protein
MLVTLIVAYNLRRSYGLNHKFVSFCRAVINRQELEAVMLNRGVNAVNIQSHVDFIKFHLPWTTEPIVRLKRGMTLHTVLYDMIIYTPWAAFTDHTMDVMTAVSLVDNRVSDCLNKLENLEAVAEVLDCLPVLLLIAAAPTVTLSDGSKLKLLERDIQRRFINSVAALPKVIVEAKQRRNYFAIASNLLTKSSFVAMLMCWLLVFTVLIPGIFGILVLVFAGTDPEITVQAIATVTAAIMAASIAVTTVFYNRMK